MLVADIEELGDFNAVVAGARERPDFIRRGLEVLDDFGGWLSLVHGVTNITPKCLTSLKVCRPSAVFIRYVINRIITYRTTGQGHR